MIQTGERLPLAAGTRMMRTGLLAQELARREHDVTWWASSFCHYSRAWVGEDDECREIQPNLKIHFLKGLGYEKNISLRRFADHALVARRFTAAARSIERPDVIVSALPDYRIAYAALQYAKRHDVPFVLDLRDRWPWDFLHELPTALHPLARLALANDFRMARSVIRRADTLVTMMRSWNSWIEAQGRRGQRPSDHIFYLGAEAPKADPSRIRPPTKEAISAANGRWVILFIGAFNNRFWPKQAVDAGQILSSQLPSDQRPLFILAGDGDFMPELQRLAAGNPDIILPGYVNDAEIAALLEVAKVGLVTGNGDFEAMPNKVFTYLSGGVPILSSLSGELEAFLEHEGVGLTCRDADALARAIHALESEESGRAAMSSKARDIFYDRYEAKRLYGQYADLVERIATGHAG